MTSRTPQLSTPEQPVLDEFVDGLRARLDDPDTDRNVLCRDTLVKIRFGDAATYDELVSESSASPAARALAASMDPRNITLEPEYYGEMDAERYYRVKPLLWLWQMFDHSTLGYNCHLAFQVRYLLAQHIFHRIGSHVRFFRGVEFSFGYNMSVGSHVTFHRFVLIDDRGPVEVGDNVSLSDWANIYTHSHELEDIDDVKVMPTVLELLDIDRPLLPLELLLQRIDLLANRALGGESEIGLRQRCIELGLEPRDLRLQRRSLRGSALLTKLPELALFLFQANRQVRCLSPHLFEEALPLLEVPSRLFQLLLVERYDPIDPYQTRRIRGRRYLLRRGSGVSLLGGRRFSGLIDLPRRRTRREKESEQPHTHE